MTTYTIDTILAEARNRSDKYPDSEWVMCGAPPNEVWLKTEGARQATSIICERGKERDMDVRPDPDVNGVLESKRHDGVLCYVPAVRLYRKP